MKRSTRGYGLLLLLTSSCTVSLVPLPVSTILLQNDGCTAPCQVTFDATAQYATTALWDFSDGNTSTELTPKHIFNQMGTYQVKLTLGGDGGRVGYTQPVTIKAPSKQWDKTIGGNNQDSLRALTASPDGGYLLGGDSYSNKSGDKSEDGRGDLDFWIVKVNANGEKQWDKTFGGQQTDKLTALVTTPDGGYLIAGYSNSTRSADKHEDSHGGFDYWIIKLNSTGDREWEKALGGANDDKLSALIVTADNGLLLGGYSNSNKSGNKSENARWDYDFWVVKLSAKGDVLWDKTLGGYSYDALQALIQTPEGDFLLGGDSTSNASGDKTDNSRGNNDYWIVKLTADGQKVWDKTIGGSGDDFLRSIAVNSRGEFLVGGYSNSNKTGEKSEKLLGGFDYWIAKFSASAEKQWDKTLGGTNNEYLSVVRASADGGALIGGYSYSDNTGNKTEGARGLADFWLLKVDASGNKQWDKTLGGEGEDKLWQNCMLEISDSSFVFGGSSNSNRSNDKINDSNGGADFWLVKAH